MRAWHEGESEVVLSLYDAFAPDDLKGHGLAGRPTLAGPLQPLGDRNSVEPYNSVSIAQTGTIRGAEAIHGSDFSSACRVGRASSKRVASRKIEPSRSAAGFRRDHPHAVNEQKEKKRTCGINDLVMPLAPIHHGHRNP